MQLGAKVALIVCVVPTLVNIKVPDPIAPGFETPSTNTSNI